ncbi:helix-turn-helix transcriptional regulator [Nonomuraea rhizosphaerae]|uniref:helix-turn-helix transcriptional regulator n=1 Tax=Nonomuraea rhizosphaerae TaxID=2665663 RepID=UPI001C603C61|nr:helix-turn-helix transcriptional regulator [Nonomuraea rhizosphaerae]
MSLASLGVSAKDEQVYRFFLRNPGVEQGAADAALGPDVGAAIVRLTRLGLLERDARARVMAVDPRETIDRLVRQRLDEVASARAMLPSLLAEQTSAAQAEHIERLDGPERARSRIGELSARVTECLAMHPVRENPSHDDVRARVLRNLGRGAVYRTIVHRRTLDDPEVAGYFRELHRAGDRHRVTDESIQTLLVFDRSTAFVPIERDNPLAGALLIRQPGVVATLVDLFEQTWARAADLEPAEAYPTRLEKQVLDLLGRMGKDEVAAREMGVSVRTFRRHVAELMARLGAVNRFQAALLAKERGWI